MDKLCQNGDGFGPHNTNEQRRLWSNVDNTYEFCQYVKTLVQQRQTNREDFGAMQTILMNSANVWNDIGKQSDMAVNKPDTLPD